MVPALKVSIAVCYLLFNSLSTLIAIEKLVINTMGQPDCYVHCAETLKLKNGTFQLIICMSPNMSSQLIGAKCLSIDMSFKRVSGKWEEFEMETWDNEYMRCKLLIYVQDY